MLRTVGGQLIRRILLSCVVGGVVGCSTERVTSTEDGGVDAPLDVGRDAVSDAPIDTGPSCSPRVPEIIADVEEPATSAAYEFSDLARIAPTTQPCSSDFSRIDRCYNAELPPPPSIRRSMIRPLLLNPEPNSSADTQRTHPFSNRPQSSGQTFVLPNHRTTTDGRLISWAPNGNQPALVMMSPENIDYGLQTMSDPARPVLSRVGYFHFATQMDPRPARSRFTDQEVSVGSFTARGRFWDMCTGTGPEQTQNPFTCTARFNAGADPRSGDCYRLTSLFANVTDNNRWEMRSIEIIAFVPNGKAVAVAPVSPNDIWVYPASAINSLQNGSVLPDFVDYDYGTQVAYVGPGMWDFNWGWQRFYDRARTECAGPNPETWCRFLTDQRTIPVGQNYRFFSAPGVSTEWNGRGEGHALLEPATTADGRVMLIHDDTQGIMYSYNTLGACRADGFRDFKPISMAYLDPDVNRRYGFAAYPIRDTQGRTYAAGETVDGGYPWIDRRGSNLMFPAGGGHDGYRTTWEHSGQLATTGELNRGNGRAVVVVGSWTRGKMIVLDNGLNIADFSFSAGWIGDPRYDGVFTLPLYSDQTVRVRPGGISLLSSLENSLNHYDALAPISPFDVVWTASATSERNAEIVFDEYLDPRALVVAHMNAPLRTIRVNYDYFSGGQRFGVGVRDQSGFESANDDGYGYHYVGNPLIQNAATGASVPSISLRGGATIQPVGEGGVLGRGVFLDGTNDHLWMPVVTSQSQYMMSLWVDVREDDWSNTTPRTLMVLPDSSRILVSQNELVFVHGEARQSIRTHIPRGRYTHLSFVVNRSGARPRVVAYQNGDPIAEVTLASGLDIAGSETQRWVIGTDGRGADEPLRAWVDEVRLYALAPSDLEGSHTRELLCNLAMGSLRRAEVEAGVCFSDGYRCDQMDLFHNEQVDAQGIGAGLDFALEAYRTPSCGARVHRNAPADCVRAEAVGTASRQLVAGDVRPPFSDLQFCVTCHQDSEDLVLGLRRGALTAGTVPEREDTRRQPMTWPRHLWGLRPTYQGGPLSEYAPMTSTYLDDVIFGDTASTLPSRIEPVAPQ